MYFASRGERSDHSFINTSLQRGAGGVLKAANRFSGFSGAVKKTAEAVTDACVGVSHPAKAGMCLAPKAQRS